MRSPRNTRGSSESDDVESTVQDTLDAFGPATGDDAGPASSDAPRGGPAGEGSGPMPWDSRQESIDSFAQDVKGGGTARPRPVAQRAMEGIALEMAMERVALSEAAAGIVRDELLITIAREVQVPLERLDLVDGYLSDLELEGRVRRVGDVMVLARPDDEDLLALDLPEDEFLERYRRRYVTPRGGGDR